MDFPAAISLLFILWVTAWRLQATEWTLYLDYVDLLVFTGIVVGLLLGVSVFHSRTVFGFGAFFTLFMIPLRLGLTMDSSISWSERLLSLAGRLWISFNQVVTNQPVQDAIFFLFSMYSLFWLTSLVAGYRVSRYGRPFMPVAIAGTALLIIDFNSPFVEYRDRYTAAFVFFCLFLLARIYYLSSKKRWAANRVAVDYEIGYHMGRSAVTAGLLLVLFSWNLPILFSFFTPGSETRQTVSQAWTEIRDRFSKIVSSLQNPTGYLNDMSADAISLGTGNASSDEILFSVNPGILSPNGFRYYWRGHSYDYYNQGTWQNSFSEIDALRPSDWPLSYADNEGRLQISFEFTLIAQALRAVYVPSRPVFVSRPVSIIGDLLGDDRVDVVSVIADPVLYSGEVYQAQALVSAPTIDELKSAGNSYPDWVTNYYLQLPQNFPESIQELAVEITQGQPTSYDKVMAITTYLRKTIQYREIIPKSPGGMEPIEWFLFDYKAGFCNYYATSEVLLLRSIGIPARLVTGYAQGVLNLNEGKYDVRLKDAHAWPEVFFPDYGWVEFEPTVSQPMTALLQSRNNTNRFDIIQDNEGRGFLRDGLDDEEESRNLEEDVKIGEDGDGGFLRLPTYLITTGSFAILAMMIIGYSILKKRYFPTFEPFVILPMQVESGLRKRGISVPRWLAKWTKYNGLLPIERIFVRLGLLMRLFKLDLIMGMTAYEKILILINAYPDVTLQAMTLLEAYHLELFSPKSGNLAAAKKASQEIWRILLRSWVRRTVGL